MILIPEIHLIGDKYAFKFRQGKTIVHTSKLYDSFEAARDNAEVFKDDMGWV